MATIREYFDTDPRAMAMHVGWSIGSADGTQQTEAIAKIAYDFEANAKYWYFYIPPTPDLSGCLGAIFSSPEFAACRLRPEGDGVHIETGHSDYSERQTSHSLQFTRRVHLYIDHELTPADRKGLVAQALDRGFYLSIRDREYARKRSESEKPLAFISHDSRDKEPFVRALAHELSKNYCIVWYDEFSLKVGDSLRASIERGLREAKKIIVVLSPNFLSNQGWGRAEFDSAFMREILERENVFLPVWHGVDARDIYNYSPRLADRVGLPSTLGVEEVARRLAGVLRSGT